jgi:RimJ/RimL family protein N-acetyltransferase
MSTSGTCATDSPALVAHPRTEMHDVVIRKLEPREYGQYRELRLECLKRNPLFFGTTYAEALATEALPFEKFIWTRDPDHVMFGAFAQGKLCGICGIQREQRQRARHRGELVQLYVTPVVARKGIGARLIATVLQYALENLMLEQVVLGVAADNRAALKTYHRAGFREYGWLERYFCSDGVCNGQLFMVYERPSATD